MIKSKKLIAVVMTAILGTALFLIGCGEKSAEPDVTAKALYNLFISGDSAEIETIAITKDEATSMLDSLKSDIKKTFSNELTAAGVMISDDELDVIYNAQMEALKKLTVKAETVSKDKDKATVKLTTTYVDMLATYEKAINDAEKEVLAMGLTSETEAVTKLGELFKKKMVENIKAVQPSTETKDATFEFEKETYDVNGKSKDIWFPVDPEKFGNEIAKMATNQ